MTAPRWLHRLPLRLPPLLLAVIARGLGVEWIALTTRGRRTGRAHTVMVDVVGRAGDGWYVQPARGRDADWVRNIVAEPRVAVRARGTTVAARARDASGDEGAAVVLRFLRTHPRYGALVVRMVGYVDRIDVPDDVLRERLRAVPVFAVELERG